MREGLKQALAYAPEIEVVAEAETGPDIIQRVDELVGNKALSAVLLDIALPGRDGLDVLQALKKSWPQLPVLMLNIYPEKQDAARCIKLGAAGYLNKSANPDDMIAAVRKVASGGLYVSPLTAEALARDIKKPRQQRFARRSRVAVAPRTPGFPATGHWQVGRRDWRATGPGVKHCQHPPTSYPRKNRHTQ